MNGLQAGGGTAIYSSLADAYRQVQSTQQTDPDRYYTIVLMSDGENTDGINSRDFENFYLLLPADVQKVRTFTVLFGDADEEAMEEIATITGGRMFDGTEESLGFIFKQIRGYQ